MGLSNLPSALHQAPPTLAAAAWQAQVKGQGSGFRAKVHFWGLGFRAEKLCKDLDTDDNICIELHNSEATKLTRKTSVVTEVGLRSCDC